MCSSVCLFQGVFEFYDYDSRLRRRHMAPASSGRRITYRRASPQLPGLPGGWLSAGSALRLVRLDAHLLVRRSSDEHLSVSPNYQLLVDNGNMQYSYDNGRRWASLIVHIITKDWKGTKKYFLENTKYQKYSRFQGPLVFEVLSKYSQSIFLSA